MTIINPDEKQWKFKLISVSINKKPTITTLATTKSSLEIKGLEKKRKTIFSI